jgi:hypothetical protein
MRLVPQIKIQSQHLPLLPPSLASPSQPIPQILPLHLAITSSAQLGSLLAYSTIQGIIFELGGWSAQAVRLVTVHTRSYEFVPHLDRVVTANKNVSSWPQMRRTSISPSDESFPAAHEYQSVCGDGYSVPIRRLMWPCSGCASSYRFEGEWIYVYTEYANLRSYADECIRPSEGLTPPALMILCHADFFGFVWRCDQLLLPSQSDVFHCDAQNIHQRPRGHVGFRWGQIHPILTPAAAGNHVHQFQQRAPCRERFRHLLMMDAPFSCPTRKARG